MCVFEENTEEFKENEEWSKISLTKSRKWI